MHQEISLPIAELSAFKSAIAKNLHTLQGKAVLVIGDIGLDEYILGGVRRISPEAPVPVVEVEQQQFRLGLAANVAQNLVSLGGVPLLVGVVGEDSAAADLRRLLGQAGVDASHLIVDGKRPTTRKTRVMVEHHHIVRVDFEERKYLPIEVEEQLLARVETLLPQSLGVIIQDYAKGVLSEKVIQQIMAMAKNNGKKVLVDPYPTTPAHFYRGASLITPNRDEALRLSGLSFDDLRIPADVITQVGNKLLQDIQCEKLIITRGKEGMSLFSEGKILRLPTYARQVFDVTGAGDTVIAAVALGWLAGFPLEQACVMANYAAGVVVAKVGCVPCSSQELLSYLESHQ